MGWPIHSEEVGLGHIEAKPRPCSACVTAGPEIIILDFMLNSADHELFSANKY